MAYFYGISPIEFIPHGEWNDPEIEYNGIRYNYHDLEDPLYEIYVDKELSISFEAWMNTKEAEYYAFDFLYDMEVAWKMEKRFDVKKFLVKHFAKNGTSEQEVEQAFDTYYTDNRLMYDKDEYTEIWIDLNKVPYIRIEYWKPNAHDAYNTFVLDFDEFKEWIADTEEDY